LKIIPKLNMVHIWWWN